MEGDNPIPLLDDRVERFSGTAPGRSDSRLMASSCDETETQIVDVQSNWARRAPRADFP
jgi:hypothetical protein